MESFVDWRTQRTQFIEDWLNQQMNENSAQAQIEIDKNLLKAMQYSLLAGGKRLRAILVYAGGECVNANLENLHFIAGAVEAVHAYSLIHDDLPCMDNDDFRRGRPTCHKKFGDAIALLAGDALHALAFEWLLKINNKNNDTQKQLTAERKLEIVAKISTAIGYKGMVGGQAMDINLTDVNQATDDMLSKLELMHHKKTGVLIKASFISGILAGDIFKSYQEIPLAIINYAELLGFLFQVVDDYLDATQDSQTLGKTAGKDAKDGKTTYVTVIGKEATKTKIEELLENIYKCVNSSKDFFPQSSTEKLVAIAQWVANRHN